MKTLSFFAIGLMVFALTPSISFGDEEKPEKPKKPKIVAGKADFLRNVKKKFARFVSADLESQPARVRLQIEGEDEEREWSILPDAEVKIHGWWGRVNQLAPNDRVWVWFTMDRAKKPTDVLMIADELSEQDIHQVPYTFKSIEEGAIVVHFPHEAKIPERKLTIPEGQFSELAAGDEFLIQTANGELREAVTAEDFEELRIAQQEKLREIWREHGLPGQVSFTHPLSGEMDLILDHEAKRWGRYLKNGDEVTIQTENPIKAVVKTVRPWRERTQIRLVASGFGQRDLTPGQRIQLSVPEPPAEVQSSDLPTDLGRIPGKSERVEWFLATIYCSCGVGKDVCTGMFYTLESCNVNACGGPNELRRIIGEMIDKEMSDEQIFVQLREDRGAAVWRPHLLR